MNKIFIIIQREYLSRVKKKSFLILTFLTPILIAGIYAFMIWMVMKDDTEKRTIAVINQSQLEEPVKSKEYTTFKYYNDIPDVIITVHQLANQARNHNLWEKQ